MKKQSRIVILVLTGLLLLSTGAPFATAAKTNDIRWYGYEEGLAKAKREGKIVYIHFFMDICKYCKEMEATTFHNQKVVEILNKKFVPIRVNSDKDYKIAYKYNIRPVPDNWFFDQNGERIFRQLGFMDASALSSLLTQIQNGKIK